MHLRVLRVFAACFPLIALAPPSTAHGLDVEASWAPNVAKTGDTAAIYLRIANDAYHAEYLYRAASPVAARVELHRTAPSGRMMKVNRMEIPFDDRLDMREAGYHLMLIGLKRTIAPGETVPLELTFSDNQIHKMNVTVPRAE